MNWYSGTLSGISCSATLQTGKGCHIKLAEDLTQEKRDKFIALLIKYQEAFAQSYKDMSRIDRDIVQHKIPQI